jgi:hypothetical protein
MKQCHTCGQLRSLDMFSVTYRDTLRARIAHDCKLCRRARNNVRNRALRIQVLTHYSGGVPKCACCGDLHLEFLSIDHIHGGGRQQRRGIKMRWWQWLRVNGYPSGFRVLCHNCNQAIGLYGYCPHNTITHLADAVAAFDACAPNKSYKLTTAQVEEIRALVAFGVSQKSLAERFNVSRANICLIVGGRRWAA